MITTKIPPRTPGMITVNIPYRTLRMTTMRNPNTCPENGRPFYRKILILQGRCGRSFARTNPNSSDPPIGNYMNNVSVFIHIYYPGSWQRIREKCSALLDGATNLIITCCYDEVMEEILSHPTAIVLKTSNKGKDIGGKLVGMAYYLNYCPRTAYVAFLHDKVSPQTINAGLWFDQLYSIFEEGALQNNEALFRQKPSVGLIGAKAFLINEWVPEAGIFKTTNDTILWKLIAQYDLSSKTYNYIGGTMFLARSEPFVRFFSRHSPLDIRSGLEKGNVLDLEHGTVTHSWERLLCFIVQSQGYTVAGA